MNAHTDELRRTVLDEYATGLSALTVARTYHLSEGTVLRWVRDAGLSRPRGGGSNKHTEQTRAAALADLNATGDPIAHVARRHGVSAPVLGQWRQAEADEAFDGTWVRDGLVWRAVPNQPPADVIPITDTSTDDTDTRRTA